jgi:hypothetical protein
LYCDVVSRYASMQDVLGFSLIVAAYKVNCLTIVQSYIRTAKLFTRNHNPMQRKGLQRIPVAINSKFFEYRREKGAIAATRKDTWSRTRVNQDSSCQRKAMLRYLNVHR